MDRIRIGTRGSKLALEQAALVQAALSQTASSVETEIVIVHTKGDRIQDKSLTQIGEKGVFASELEQALLEGLIDVAVHSAKDLPMTLARGLGIAAVLPRGDVRDVLVIPKGGRLPAPAAGGRNEGIYSDACTSLIGEQVRRGEAGKVFRIGSGSRRRRLLSGRLWESVTCEEIRGNVDTRLRKLQEGGYDGIILAKAGLDRLGIGREENGCEGSGGSDGGAAFLFCPLAPEVFLPAACQGIIAVETVQDSGAETLCRRITDAETQLCFQVEREVLTQLAADCSEAAAAWCRQEQDRLVLDAMYAGRTVSLSGRVDLQEGKRLAVEAAKLLRTQPDEGNREV